jgi:hypothetical protein
MTNFSVRSYQMKIITELCIITFLVIILLSCTYDRTLIYHKDYDPGKHSELRLNGFYSTTAEIVTEQGRRTFIQPVFFYNDGSVIFMGNHPDTSDLRLRISTNPKAVWGRWGNYQISGDTIKIESLVSFQKRFHHTRYTQVGLVMSDGIHFLYHFDKKGNITADDYTVHFTNFNIKPDSTSNWIRTKRKFNR